MRAQPNRGVAHIVLAAALAAALVPLSQADGWSAAAVQPEPPVAFHVPQTRLRVGHTAILPLRRTGNAGPDAAHLEIEASADASVLQTLSPARFLKGEQVGYIRVQGISPGRTTLAVGEASIEVVVIPAPSASVPVPVIDGPADGAAVWGRITVGMRFEVGAGSVDATPRVVVDDDAGRALEPAWLTTPEQGPTRLAAFTLAADDLAEGLHTLTPVLIAADGTETTGEPVRIRIVRPAAGSLTEGEAESPPTAERPESFGPNPPSVQQNANASGGAFAVNSAAYPPVCFPLQVDRAGWYQVMLRAGGTYAGGAFPTVNLLVDESFEPVTNAPLLTSGWHRFTLGVPIFLRPGEHTLTPFFANDFYVPNLVDRNLWLDKIEILRIADAQGYREPGAGVLGTPTMAGVNSGEAPMTDGDSPQMSSQMMMMQEDVSMMMGARSGAAVIGVGPARVSIDGFDDLARLEAHPVRIAFASNLHDRELTGELEVKGVCWWEGMRASKPAPPPTVALELNGWEIAKQRAASPTFWLDPAHFTQRENTVRLIARLDDGSEAATPVQTVIAPWIAPDTFPTGSTPPRAFHRFTIHDPRWDADLRRRLRNEHDPEERAAAAFYSNAAATLNLPEDLQGTFDIHLTARGQHFDGPPILHITLEHDNGVEELEPFGVPEWWGPHHAGRITIPPGAKELKLAYRNDKYTVGRGDRNLWFQAVALQEVSDAGQAAPAAAEQPPANPVVEITYPPAGHEVYGADAIVATVHAEASPGRGVRWAELVWDGEPTGIRLDMARGVNPLVFYLPLRDVEPGDHEAAVRIADLSGNVTVGQPVQVHVLSQPPPLPGRFDRAVHLLNRFAWGPAPDELAAVLTRGERTWLEEQLRAGPDHPGLVNAVALGMVRFAERRSGYDVPRRALEQARVSPVPARDRFVLWTQNHFSTWMRKSEPSRKWDEHAAFTRLGAAPFIDLLEASATSPAMLRYLDQDQSFAGRLNENYAREIMELHTLGVDGGYAQHDVTRLASVFTGWMAVDQGDGRSGGQGAIVHSFRFDPTLCDPSPRIVIGYEFASADPVARHARAQEALELLAGHPSTARFICRELAAHYVAHPADQSLVDHLAAVFMQTGGDMVEVLLALSATENFWNELTEKHQRLTKPVEHGLRFSRTTGQTLTWAVCEYLDLSGMGLFDRATPDGYPEEEAPYSDSNAMLQRWRLARQTDWALANLVPGPWRWDGAELDEAAARRIADTTAIRLTGRPLSEASLAAVVQIMLEGKGTRDERIRRGAMLVGQLPEASLK